DSSVTGVQTCALPISQVAEREVDPRVPEWRHSPLARLRSKHPDGQWIDAAQRVALEREQENRQRELIRSGHPRCDSEIAERRVRSEERRVGKGRDMRG